MTSALMERTIIAGRFLWGDTAMKAMIADHFGDQVPQLGTAEWTQFAFACRDNRGGIWLQAWGPQHEGTPRLPAPELPKFPKALEATDFFPYDVHRPQNGEPFWIGFWSAADARNPYRFSGNATAWENGRELAKTKNAELYRSYVAACRKTLRGNWGEKTVIP